MPKEMLPSEEITEFLKFVDSCISRYKFAFENVGQEDKRLQDLVHEIEFASNKSERNRAATKLQQSRRIRRKNKDEAKLYEKIAKFFEDRGNKNTLNQLRQLLGQQRKEEEYLSSNRTYKPRIEE